METEEVEEIEVEVEEIEVEMDEDENKEGSSVIGRALPSTSL